MNFARGKFSLKNPAKYVGTKTPTYRSSWEQSFMRLCDEHPNVYQWASEAIRILCARFFYCVHGQKWKETR
jgi:hypothetical protein